MGVVVGTVNLRTVMGVVVGTVSLPTRRGHIKPSCLSWAHQTYYNVFHIYVVCCQATNMFFTWAMVGQWSPGRHRVSFRKLSKVEGGVGGKWRNLVLVFKEGIKQWFKMVKDATIIRFPKRVWGGGEKVCQSPPPPPPPNETLVNMAGFQCIPSQCSKSQVFLIHLASYNDIYTFVWFVSKRTKFITVFFNSSSVYHLLLIQLSVTERTFSAFLTSPFLIIRFIAM